MKPFGNHTMTMVEAVSGVVVVGWENCVRWERGETTRLGSGGQQSPNKMVSWSADRPLKCTSQGSPTAVVSPCRVVESASGNWLGANWSRRSAATGAGTWHVLRRLVHASMVQRYDASNTLDAILQWPSTAKTRLQHGASPTDGSSITDPKLDEELASVPL